MPETVSEDMVRDAYRQGGAGERVLLLTITSDHLPDPLLLTDSPDGLVSRGQTFRFAPFAFSFAGASADQPSRECEIEIGRSADVAVGIKAAPKNTVLLVTVEMVRPSAPDFVERAFRNTRVSTSDLDGPTIKFNLRSKSFQDEFACSKRYLISRTPGLFGAMGAGS